MARGGRRGSGPARWAGFPVDYSPRPLVLLSEVTRTSGFTTGQAKVAWADGAITVAADVPDAVRAALPRRRARAVGPDLVLDRSGRGEAEFRTDRGPMTLPVWLLDGAGLLGDGCVVLDPSVHTWWSSSDEPGSFSGPLNATVDPTGCVVHLPVTGGWYTEFVRAEFEEHDAYVVGRGVTRERVPRGVEVVPLVMRYESVRGQLQRPLGDRVLVTERGDPVGVVDAD